ncbi:MAG: glycosyltransferase [Patescibacteria group bacterium]
MERLQKMINDTIKNYHVLVVSHYYARSNAGAPSYEIVNYLLDKVKYLVYVEHPFPYASDNNSYIFIFKNGKKIKEFSISKILKPDIFSYLQDFFYNNLIFLLLKKRFDLCIALDNLNTFSFLFWRKLHLIKKLVLYTIDYAPYRFQNKLLNSIYHFIDRRACYNCDCIWVLSERMIKGRMNNGVNPKRCAYNVAVPMGADLSKIKLLPYENINRFTIVFLGHLLQKQGLQLVLEILTEIKKEIPQIKLIIIGQGDYEYQLKKIATELEINDVVEFKGFIRNHQEIEKILCHSTIGLAPYLQDKKSFTYFADPGKIKVYLGCGLPVITTRFTVIADEIEKENTGIVINYNRDELRKALLRLLQDDQYYQLARKNAINLSKKYNFKNIYDNAIKQTLFNI